MLACLLSFLRTFIQTDLPSRGLTRFDGKGDVSMHKLGIVKALPSVTELVDCIVADMHRRRPENWRSLVGPERHSNIVPSVRLSNAWEGSAPSVGVFPLRSNQLEPKEANGEGANENFETILDIDYASKEAVEFAADSEWRIHGKQPNVNAIGNLERVAESVPLFNGKKRIV